MKYLVVAVCCLSLGYFLYPRINPSPDVSPEKKARFETFVNEEGKKFAETQDADAKLKAAEEMYGKMMVLFLAEMGLRAKHELRPVIASKTALEAPLPEISIDEAPLKKHAPIAADSATKKLDQPKPKDKLQDAWVKYSTTPFLEAIKGKDRRLIGQFEGTLTHKDVNEGRVDTVVMEFNLTQTDKEISGNTTVSMIDASGKEYSRNAGNGGNRALKGSDLPDTYYGRSFTKLLFCHRS